MDFKMVIDFARRELVCKIVYYGPTMSGKTTNLTVLHRKAPKETVGRMTSLATYGDRTLFFDFFPMDVGVINGLRIKLQLYTVPGQPFYVATRRLVLNGVDGVVFVADSDMRRMKDNLESLRDLQENLASYGKSLDTTAIVLQYNKRDLPSAAPVEYMDRLLNVTRSWCSFESVAVAGVGVLPTFKKVLEEVLQRLKWQT